jgi:acyl-CoA synthetase (AMP-forming)/AMP-acid ligase II
MTPIPAFDSLVQLTTARAEGAPDQCGFIFLKDGEVDAEPSRLAYGQLAVRARAIGAALAEAGAAGQRVFLAFPPGIDFIQAFYGCLHGAAIGVPLPAVSRPMSRALYRVKAIAADARPSAILTSRELSPLVGELKDKLPELAAATIVDVDAVPDHMAADWRDPGAGGDDLAFLQYTSGSTSLPKGVMVTHGGIVGNAAFYHAGWDHGPDAVAVTWMPSFHDLGLMDGVIQPLLGGYLSVVMSPVSFLQRPMRWLEAVTRYRATVTGGPNFSFELCMRKSHPREQLASLLDLRSLRGVLNAAEPVRLDTMERFAQHFAPAGFRLELFCPGFGLAEATLKVAATRAGGRFHHLSLDRSSLEQGLVRQAPAGAVAGEVQVVVGCGPAADRAFATEAVIVDPDTLVRCERDRVGEIWVRGSTVAKGYFARPDATRDTFEARITGEAGGPFMRTGDLGFVHEGELYVTGRLKDLIIVNGRNVYPQDLERTAEEAAAPDLRAGASAAVSIAGEAGEAVVLIAELQGASTTPAEEVVRAIRHRVMELHDVVLHEVVLIRQSTIFKTSSGKIQRRACRDAYLAGSLVRARPAT